MRGHRMALCASMLARAEEKDGQSVDRVSWNQRHVLMEITGHMVVFGHCLGGGLVPEGLLCGMAVAVTSRSGLLACRGAGASTRSFQLALKILKQGIHEENGVRS